MSAGSSEAVDILRAILAELKVLNVRLSLGPAGGVAEVPELEGEDGDPAAPFDPKKWQGASCKGKSFSRCEPGALDLLAEYFDYCAENPRSGKEKFSAGERRKARLARGWAKRIRGGWKAPVEAKANGAARPRGGFGSEDSATTSPRTGGYGGEDEGGARW